MEEQRTQQIDNSQLAEPLSSTLKEFLAGFSALPPQPNTINPHYMRYLLNMLVEDVCSEEPLDHLWWEMVLYLAKKWTGERGDQGQPVLQIMEQLEPLLSEHFSDDDSQVTLQEVTQKTLFGIMMLSETLSEPKRYFVAPNAVSFAQAHFAENAWFRAIYAGRAPVGFVMLSLDEEKSEYFVWRFMIGEVYHGRGYGREAMAEIKAHVKTLPNTKELLLSYGQGPGSPEGFYKKLEFQPTGEVHGEEIVAKISL